MINNKYAFTIVELIIITILFAIIGVVVEASYYSYLSIVRDSTRFVELDDIETSLGTYILNSGFYPDPSYGKNITYSGALVWSQGTYGESVKTIMGDFNDYVDPLTKNEYTYSVKNSRKEYSIAGVLETNQGLLASNTFIGTANAEVPGSKKGIAVVKGNYNGEIVSILLNGVTNILALPSIITSDLSDVLNNNKLVYNEFGNIPASFSGSVYSFAENINFAPNNLVVYSGSISNLKETYNQLGLLQAVRLAYSGSILGKNISVNRVDDTDLFSPEPSSKTKILACDLINFKLKYFVECGK